ncbi:Ku protein [Luteolibacter algae]|uniref:Non-homologous end joining protein Ku n=1 Tax=Luteolibacter algae TaxID=454151 RepID=A0ABW5D6Y9_9BACT
MARAIWKGSIAFGLVNIPVALTSAESRPDIQLHMVDSSNHARIRYERVNADTGEEVPWDRMVKAYEHDDGKFVLLTKDELDTVQPELTKTIEISEFVDLLEIDPILFDKPYYLEPEKRGRKAYALLREALRKTNKAGISRVVIRTREYLSAMFVRDDVLILMLLRFPQEIKKVSTLELPASGDNAWKPVKKEMDLAVKLIGDMTEEWKPADIHDEYRESLMAYIEKKISKGDAVSDVRDPDDGDDDSSSENVVDLASYLEKSVQQASGKKSSGTSDGKTAKKPTRKTPAKKAPAKKTTRKNASKKSSSTKSKKSA